MGRFFEGGRWHDTGIGPSVEWTMNVGAKCVLCGVDQSVTVLCDDVKRYIYEDQLVQNVWPDLSPDDRDVIISWRNKKTRPNWDYHVCPSCYPSEEE